MNQRKLGSTDQPMTFFMTLASDHVSPATGKTPVVTVSKNAGAFAAAAGAVSEIGNGWYALAPDAADRDTAGELALHATAADADPADQRYVIVPWDPFDANLGLERLDKKISEVRAGGGGTVLVPALTSEDVRRIVEEIWRWKERTLTAFAHPVEIRGEVKRLDALERPLPREAVRDAAREALEAQGYTAGRAERLDRLDRDVSSREAKGSAAAAARGVREAVEASGSEMRGRLTGIDERVSAIGPAVEDGRRESREAAQALGQAVAAGTNEVLEGVNAGRAEARESSRAVDEAFSTLDTAEAASARHAELRREQAEARAEARTLHDGELARLDSKAEELLAELGKVLAEAQAIRDSATKAEGHGRELVRERRAVRAAAARRLPTRRM